MVLMGLRSDILRVEMGGFLGRRFRKAETGECGMGERDERKDLERRGFKWGVTGRRKRSMGLLRDFSGEGCDGSGGRNGVEIV